MPRDISACSYFVLLCYWLLHFLRIASTGIELTINKPPNSWTNPLGHYPETKTWSLKPNVLIACLLLLCPPSFVTTSLFLLLWFISLLIFPIWHFSDKPSEKAVIVWHMGWIPQMSNSLVLFSAEYFYFIPQVLATTLFPIYMISHTWLHCLAFDFFFFLNISEKKNLVTMLSLLILTIDYILFIE